LDAATAAAGCASRTGSKLIPPGKRRFITRDELVAQSGTTQADLDKVTEFARSHGFKVLETSASRRIVRVSGTVGQANRAFAVDLGRYESPEESYRVDGPYPGAATVNGHRFRQ
jgi:subtilase family serine protease